MQVKYWKRKKLKEVQKFNYLENGITHDGKYNTEIQRTSTIAKDFYFKM